MVGGALVAGGVQLLMQEPVVQAQDFSATRVEMNATSPITIPAPSDHEESPLPGALTAVAHAPTPVPPTQVTLPGVTAEVVPVGVLPSGELLLPDPARVGWWAAGSLPGEGEGTVVLAGHMDGLRRGGAMSALLDVEPSDVVSLEDSRGRVHDYRVVERSTTPQESLDPALFARGGAHRLVLVTCGGTYDEATGRYSENIVVIAEPVA